MTHPIPEIDPGEARAPWLVRLPEVFADEGAALLRRWSPTGSKRLGSEFHLLKAASAEAMAGAEAALFASWRLPVHHSWPCRPRTMPGFVEKAAQGLARRFAGVELQTARVGLLQTGTPNTYYKKLASNLRGRMLQLFPKLTASEGDLAPDLAVLFCLLGPEGVFAGVSTPRQAGGFRAGGPRSMARSGPDVISRAGAKIEEALDFLQLYRDPPAAGAHWLELGASPGGMTAALLVRGYRVTAVDRAPLDGRLTGLRGLRFEQVDAPDFRGPPGEVYDALLCDLNGDPRAATAIVSGHSRSLRRGAPVIFTLKLAGVDGVAAVLQLRDQVVAQARDAGLSLLAQTHLPSNRREFTLVLESLDGPRR
jgi:hypothetical protein